MADTFDGLEMKNHWMNRNRESQVVEETLQLRADLAAAQAQIAALRECVIQSAICQDEGHSAYFCQFCLAEDRDDEKITHEPNCIIVNLPAATTNYAQRIRADALEEAANAVIDAAQGPEDDEILQRAAEEIRALIGNEAGRAAAKAEQPKRDAQLAALLKEIRGVAEGMLPDGDGVNVSTTLWADSVLARFNALAQQHDAIVRAEGFEAGRQAEIGLYKGGSHADEKRLIAAAARADVPYCGCDTPDALAEKITEMERQLRAAQGDYQGFLNFMRNELAALPCCHDAGTHADTPPLMWPELVRCIVTRAASDAFAAGKAEAQAEQQAAYWADQKQPEPPLTALIGTMPNATDGDGDTWRDPPTTEVQP